MQFKPHMLCEHICSKPMLWGTFENIRFPFFIKWKIIYCSFVDRIRLAILYTNRLRNNGKQNGKINNDVIIVVELSNFQT